MSDHLVTCAICRRRGWLAMAITFDIDLGLSLCARCKDDVSLARSLCDPVLPGCDLHGRCITIEYETG